MSGCRGELLQRVRRGLATDQEKLALAAHLDYCTSCSLVSQVATDFDPVGLAQTGDLALVVRVASRAVSGGNGASVARAEAGVFGWSEHRLRRFLSGRRRVIPFFAAALFFGGVAAAAVGFQAGFWVEQEPPTKNGTALVVQAQVRPAATKGSAATNKGEPTPSLETVDEAERVDLSFPAREPRHAAERADLPASVSWVSRDDRPVRLPVAVRDELEETSAELYKWANSARRTGDTDKAVRRYRKLQRRYPASPQARQSYVSLAGVYLESGQAHAALLQFDAYLAQGGGRLAAEALFGKAQALKVLGRGAEETKTWKELLRRYPNSVYSAQARQNLAD